MTTRHTKAASATAAIDETPWYDLIDDPEPPEDAMQQVDTILYVMSILQARYGSDPNTLWSRRTNIVYDSAIRGSVVAPDGYVVFGVDARAIERDCRNYRIDEWGEPPAFVMEVATESTATRDLTEKREIYARMGAQEYWRLDKRTEYYGEPLVGERLVDGEYRRCEIHVEANGDIWSRSEALGVDFFFRIEEGEGRFLLRDSMTGKWLHNLPEEIAAHARTKAALEASKARLRAAEAKAQAQAAEEARLASEARNRELMAEIERLRRRQ